MKKTVSALVLALSIALPQGAFAAYSYTDGWPKWIGRLNSVAYFRNEDRPHLGPQYLPLSLVRTGKFNKLVEDVMSTPNTDSTRFPEWIGN